MKQVILQYSVLLKLLSPLLIAGLDYTSPGAVTLTFNSTTTSQTVSVTILDDDILEENKTFIGNLTTTDDRVDLHPSTTTAIITDVGKLLS